MATSEANNITEGDAITTKPTTATAAGSVTDDEQSQEAVPIKKNSSILKKDSNIGNDEGDVKLPKKMSSLTIVGGDSKTTDDGVGDGDEKNNDEEDTKRRRTVSFSKLEIIEFLIQVRGKVYQMIRTTNKEDRASFPPPASLFFVCVRVFICLWVLS